MFPTRHAVRRFQERVAPVSAAEAFRRLEELGRHSKVRATPRWWTDVAPQPGLLFGYPAELPGVCLLIKDDAIITVYERSHCRQWQAEAEAYGAGNPLHRRQAYRRPSAGSMMKDAA